MNFGTTAFAFICGSALVAFGVRKLGNICKMQPQNYNGVFIYEDNKNCQLEGTGTCNQGRITGNRNLKIYCENSTAEILKSSNVDVNIINSSLNARNQSNCKISVNESEIDMESDKNMDISAKGAWCKFADNKNVNFREEAGTDKYFSQFIGNENGRFSGRSNKVSAFRNKNLNIEGNNNSLDISETRNHDIQPASIGSNRNCLTIQRSGENSIQFVIEYVGATVIKATEYKLGIIEFRIVEDIHNFKVTLTLQDVVDIVYSIVDTQPSKIIIQAEKNGIIQTLELKGERVDALSLNSLNIFFIHATKIDIFASLKRTENTILQT